MKILLVTDLYPLEEKHKGIPLAIENFALALKDLGCEISVLRADLIFNSILRGRKPSKQGWYERNGIEVLPCAYSLETFTHALRNPAIVHMLGGYKPWEKLNFAPKDSGKLRVKPKFVQNPYHKSWWRIARKNVFYLEILLPYLKRSANITLSAYTKAYAPALYPLARKLKHLLKRRK